MHYYNCHNFGFFVTLDGIWITYKYITEVMEQKLKKSTNEIRMLILLEFNVFTPDLWEYDSKLKVTVYQLLLLLVTDC